jgi:hypothetical protein
VPAAWQDPTNDAAIERRIRRVALPVALALAVAVSRSGLRGITRTFLTMWVHELGHAVAAWLCGFGAFPGPWLTPISEQRMPVVTVMLLGALGYAGYRAWRGRALGVCLALAAVLGLQLVLTFGVRSYTARGLILFAGDGGCFVLGALLMATIFVRPGSALHRGWLRWGFLVIGAFAFADALATWWDARYGGEGVVFGQNEGVGDSDPTRLVYEQGWAETVLVQRYLNLAKACLVGLTALWVVNLRRQ